MTQVACLQCSRIQTVTPQIQGRKVPCACGLVYHMPGEKIESRAAANTAVTLSPRQQLISQPPAQSPNRPVATAHTKANQTTAPSTRASLPSESSLQVACPRCNKPYKIPAKLAGKSVKCHCGHSFLAESNNNEILEPEFVD